MNSSKFRRLVLLAPLALMVGCSSESSGGGSGGSTGSSSGGSGGSRTGSGGSSPSGTGGSSSTGSGGSGSGGSVGSGGVTGAGGSGGGSGGGGGASGGSSGAAGSGGSAGSRGDAAAETGGSAVGVEAVGKVAKTLFKITIMRYDPDGRSGCSTDPLIRANRNEDTLKGDPNTTYDVTLRVRGLTEPKVYNGGMPDPANPFVNIGGTPSTAGRENASNQYVRLSVEVGDPKQVYWLNRFHGMHTDHEVYEYDYKLVVKAKGGSTLATVLADGNACAIANHRNKVVPGVPADVIMQPFKDQFLLVEVESVKPAM